MLQHLITQQHYFALKLFSALGCGLIAGVFFAFSTFVMNALARLKPTQGIAAMQSINITVINPLFMAAFLGTAAACIFLLISSLLRWHQPGAAYLLLGSLLYLVGTLGVTIVFNVPLNEALAKVESDSTDAASLWSSYLANWTIWNHIRAAAALAAATSLTIALCLGSRIVGGLDNTVS
ncbi:anthrone oxygenase family protein [Nostoc sp.]|uniref:anthrone oxygenase family protein n=1 Tax=Nostoc sp. TaxID=1180 RepID=UPI002FF9FB2B